MEACPKTMGGIDDQRQPVLRGQRRQRRHVTWIAKIMAGGDGNRAWGDRCSHGLQRDIRRAGFDIDEHGPKVVPDDRGGASQKRKARDDHLTEWFAAGATSDDAKPRQRLERSNIAAILAPGLSGRPLPATAATAAGRQVEPLVDQHQTDRATADSNRMANTQPRRDRLLQTIDIWPLREPAAGQNLGCRRTKRLPRGQGRPHERHADPGSRWIGCRMHLWNDGEPAILHGLFELRSK